jgi:tetratricopeptide (TPR) repeat protein
VAVEFAQADVSGRIAECARMASASGHLERALSAVRDKLWSFSRETKTAVEQKVEAEDELQAARTENSRLAADKSRAEGELQSARTENSRLAADKSRAEGELQAARTENSRLAADKSRAEGELQSARTENSRLVVERDKLTVEIARQQVKQRAARERLESDSARWSEAAVAAAYARRSQPEDTRRRLKLIITASGWRLKCSISTSRWERGPRMSLALADRALNECQWQLAARCYGDVLEQWPKNAAVWVQFGHALKESGKVAEAEAVYRHSIQLNPAVADTHLQLGHALKLLGRHSEAIEAYVAALRLDPALDYAADELRAVGWTSSDIEKTKLSR